MSKKVLVRGLLLGVLLVGLPIKSAAVGEMDVGDERSVAPATTEVESTASIGFSTKTSIVEDPPKVIPGGDDGNSIKTTGRLPTTGEFVSAGMSGVGLMFLIILTLYWMRQHKTKTEERQ